MSLVSLHLELDALLLGGVEWFATARTRNPRVVQAFIPGLGDNVLPEEPTQQALEHGWGYPENANPHGRGGAEK